MLLIYNMEEEQTFKTPDYQRKAYKNYYARKKEDPNWIEDQKQKRKDYYEKNKEKILERLKNKRINSKLGDTPIPEKGGVEESSTEIKE